MDLSLSACGGVKASQGRCVPTGVCWGSMGLQMSWALASRFPLLPWGQGREYRDHMMAGASDKGDGGHESSEDDEVRSEEHNRVVTVALSPGIQFLNMTLFLQRTSQDAPSQVPVSLVLRTTTWD